MSRCDVRVSESTALEIVLTGAVSGFLIFSLPVQANHTLRCFMGDGGSTLLGFGTAWLAIDV